MNKRAALRTVLVLLLLVSACPLAEAQSRDARNSRRAPVERYVFVTGSLLPQRVGNNGTVTAQGSPVSVINRRRIDGTGRFTTEDILRTEPALFVWGF